MLYDNAPLLKTYVHAFQLTGDPLFKEVAFEIIRFVFEVLTDPKSGCFRSSQDADVHAGDDGSYFTWTTAQARNTLSAEEFKVLQLRFNLYDRGEMTHDTKQNVLFIDKEFSEIEAELGIPPESVAQLYESGRSKLREARQARKSPSVDPTIYAAWNGMMIAALLEAFKAFELDQLKHAALSSLDWILREHRLGSGLFSHRAARISGEAFLEDQTALLDSLLSAYEVTGGNRYLREALALADAMVKHFWDAKSAAATPSQVAAFNDVPVTHDRLGTLAISSKPIQDSPTSSPNGVAVLCLLRLHALTGDTAYRERAERALRYFAGGIEGNGVFAATYFLGLQSLLFPPLHVVTTGPEGDPQAEDLHKTALRTFRPGKVVLRVDLKNKARVPPAAQGIVGSPAEPMAVVCGASSCSAPVSAADELARLISSFDRRKSL
jgi:uncharacterized protein YyaL (SSP411 family)